MANAVNRDWLQIGGFAGVIAGLLLVAYEVQQANKVASAEAMRGMADRFDAIQIESFSSSDIFEIYVKSFERPHELTDAELLRIDSWLTISVGYWDSRMRMEDLGLMPPGAAKAFDSLYDYMFGSRLSFAWFSRNKGWLHPELVEIIERRMEGSSIASSPPLVEVLRSGVEEPGMTVVPLWKDASVLKERRQICFLSHDRYRRLLQAF